MPAAYNSFTSDIVSGVLTAETKIGKIGIFVSLDLIGKLNDLS